MEIQDICVLLPLLPSDICVILGSPFPSVSLCVLACESITSKVASICKFRCMVALLLALAEIDYERALVPDP